MLDRNASTSLGSTLSNTSSREPVSTPRHTTRRRVRHGWLVGLAAALAGAGCGGGSRGDTYAKATSAQEACCENLQGTARDQCLQQIVRVEDPEVAKTGANQDTYACVQRHFVCDPETGHATKDSAQAQYDCIAELEQ